MANLTKMFVQVPASLSTVSVADVKAKSMLEGNTGKLYFVEKYNQIVVNGVAYGIDPKSSKELESLISALGGTVGADGTVSFDLSALNYKGEAATILDVIKALDAKIKTEMDKLGASKTLNENWEFTGKLKYVPAVKDSSAAYIVMTDEDDNELANTKINVSDIIGNGVLKKSAYDAATGILTLTFAQADGTEKAIEVDLKAMLDINDMSIAADSTNYLKVDLGTASVEGETQAVFGAKIVSMANAKAAHDDVPAVTGLADALDVKTYVDSKATDLAVTAEGDAYVSASVNADVDNKHVIVAANVKDVTASAGIRGTWSVSDAGVATLSGETAPSMSGVANSLIDGAQGAEAVKTYVDAVVAAEAAERVAKISAAVKALDKNATETKGSNVHVTMSEVDGIVSIDSVVEDYATVNRTASTSTSAAPTTDGAISVADGDAAKLIKASDLAAVAAYAADKAKEAQNKVEKQIADLGGDVTSDDASVASVQVITEAGEVSDVVVTTISAGVNRTGDAKNARVLAATLATGAVTGGDIAAIKGYVDDVVADNTADLAVTAEGDTFVSASVDAGVDNKHVIVKANTNELTIAKVGEADTTISGVATTLVSGGEIASKVSTFVNTRIAEEIDKLDKAEALVSATNAQFKYSEANGIVSISDFVLDYATVSKTDGAKNGADSVLNVTDGAKIATGNDVKTAAEFAVNRIGEEIAKLDVEETNVAEAGEGAINFNYSETDGKVAISGLSVTYATHAAKTDLAASQINNGIVTGTVLNEVLGDLWETYTA